MGHVVRVVFDGLQRRPPPASRRAHRRRQYFFASSLPLVPTDDERVRATLFFLSRLARFSTVGPHQHTATEKHLSLLVRIRNFAEFCRANLAFWRHNRAALFDESLDRFEVGGEEKYFPE